MAGSWYYSRHHNTNYQNHMKFAICTTVWGRYEITEAFYKYYAWLRHKCGLDFELVVGASTLHEVKTAAAYNALPIFTPNRPVSRKWNAVTMACRLLDDLQGVIVVGSDDFMSEAYVRGLLSAGAYHDWVSTSVIHFYDLPTGRILSKHVARIGGGRWLSRAVLEEAEWQVHGDRCNRFIDGSQEDIVRALGYDIHRHNPHGPIVAVKGGTEENMWGFEKFMGHGDPIKLATMRLEDARSVWYDNFPKSLADWMCDRQFEQAPAYEMPPDTVLNIRKAITEGDRPDVHKVRLLSPDDL